MKGKKCLDCVWKPLSEFYECTQGALGRGAYCKDCHNKRSTKYNIANRDQITMYQAEYYVGHRDQLLTQHAKYRAANKDLLRTKQAKYRAANREKINRKSLERYHAKKALEASQ